MREPRPTLALVVAVLALVVALSSSATAALVVHGKDIKRGTVTSTQVKNQSLTGRDIRNGSIRPIDLAAGIRASLAQAGTPGPAGEPGPAGPAGGLAGHEYRTAAITYGTGAHAAVSVACPAGTVATGGGGAWVGMAAPPVDADKDTYLHQSGPMHATRDAGGAPTSYALPTTAGQVPDAWTVTGWNGSGSSRTLRAWVICAEVG